MERLPESNWFPTEPSMQTEHGSVLEYVHADLEETEESMAWRQNEELQISHD